MEGARKEWDGGRPYLCEGGVTLSGWQMDGEKWTFGGGA